MLRIPAWPLAAVANPRARVATVAPDAAARARQVDGSDEDGAAAPAAPCRMTTR